MIDTARILVVDDEPAIHRFLAPALAANGYIVSAVHTGAEAIRKIAAEAPDAVTDPGPRLARHDDGKDRNRASGALPSAPCAVIKLSARDREAEKC